MLESFVGQGFAAALQDGLSRSVSPYASAPRSGSGRRFGPLERHDRTQQHSDSAELPQGVLLPHEAGAILRLFEQRLHSALQSDRELELDTLAVRAALTACAHRILDDAGVETDGAAAEPAPHSPALPALTPELTAAAGSLLTECALLHVMAGTHSTQAVARAISLIQPIGRAVRRQSIARPVTADAHRDLWHERRRLAREIHDGLGTNLSVALRRLELRAEHDEDPDGHLAAAGTCLRSALGHARDLVTGLREETVVPPLREAVESFAAQAAPDSVSVTFSATGAERQVPDSSRHQIFLAVRECLRNCFEHAAADRVTVTSRVTRRWAHVRVKDDGVGFDACGTGPDARDGNGLRCMADRIAEIGGRVTIDSRPGEGTSVDIHLPLQARP
ncbi:sensor histidine kinase [Streptomyces narbonensis]|uniref:sensor histidine kinase n=1 Tax=Streptomyces narbonensis TaxID=67333 RepID=UPI001677B920|nr:ATP-binding protein [Streptomyces narbonensis]